MVSLVSICLVKYPAKNLTTPKKPESRVECYVKTQLQLSMISELYGKFPWQHSVGSCIVPLSVSFVFHYIFSFKKSQLLNVSLSVCTISILFRKLAPVPIHPVLLSLLWGSDYLVLFWDFWYNGTEVSHWVINMDLLAFFYRQEVNQHHLLMIYIFFQHLFHKCKCS